MVIGPRRRPPTLGELSRAAEQLQIAIMSGAIIIRCDNRTIVNKQPKEQYL